MPVLWLDVPELGSADRLHEALTPAHLQDAVQAVGVLGGISQAVCPTNFC